MYKALIIDDENPVRKVIKALGKWQEMEVEYVYEAFEGESALKIMRENRPEIVFLDMKMPNMDGVEFLKQASKEFPRSKYIVVSGYDDFEYTKQAIKSRVSDYLLKPIVEDELNDALKKVVDELNEEVKQKIDKMRMDIMENTTVPIAQERIITLLQGNEEQFSDLEASKISEIYKAYKFFGVVILSIINFDEVCSNKFSSNRKLTITTLLGSIHNKVSEWGEDFIFRNRQASNEVIFISMGNSEKEGEFISRTIEKINCLLNVLETEYGVFCLACVGKPCLSPGMIKNSYISSMQILEKLNVLDTNEKIFVECDVKHKSRKISLMDKKELLIYAIESGSIDYTRKILDQYFASIREYGYLSREDLYLTAMEFIQIMENIAEKLGVSVGERTKVAFIKLEDFSEFVFKMIEKIFSSIQMNLKANQSTSLYEIKDYIDKNYNKEIKLSKFSDMYYISKEYLSKQFKAEFGFGIYEYVLKVRMKKADDMLSNKNVKISTIAEQLGYNNNNYFSNAFKNYYGMSPTEYREKINNKVKE